MAPGVLGHGYGVFDCVGGMRVLAFGFKGEVIEWGVGDCDDCDASPFGWCLGRGRSEEGVLDRRE